MQEAMGRLKREHYTWMKHRLQTWSKNDIFFFVGVTLYGKQSYTDVQLSHGTHHTEDASIQKEVDSPTLCQHKVLERESSTCTEDIFGKKNEKLKMLISGNHKIVLHENHDTSLFCD